MDAPRSVVLTAEERKHGAYDSTNVQKALEGMYQDGLVVLKDVAAVEHIDALNKFMTAEADSIMEVKSKEPLSAWNQGVPCECSSGEFFESFKLRVYSQLSSGTTCHQI